MTTLPDDNEISAYLEDVKIFVELIRNDPDALHTNELGFFREYLKELGATLPDASAALPAVPAPAPGSAPAPAPPAPPADPRYADKKFSSGDGGAAVAAWAREAGSSARKVDLSGRDKITDAAIYALAANCTNLTSINLSGCKKITDAAIAALAANCANLTTIDLQCCGKITDAAITDFKHRLPNCKTR